MGREHSRCGNHAISIFLAGLIAAITPSCSNDAPRASAIEPAERCFRSTHSVLLGPPTTVGQQGAGPGWVQLSGTADAESGMAALSDSDGKRLEGRWSRQGDTISIVASDDFLRVELLLTSFSGGIAGEGNAHSDATLEPDASGRVGELRRRWPFAAERLPCDTRS